MRVGTLIFVCLLLKAASWPAALELRAPRYQRAGGAIVLQANGDFVDPYFALKALLTAQNGGLDIREPAIQWIQWLLPRQLPDGRFQRYCFDAGKWRACKGADADDALLALWLQLLYRLAPASGLPSDWRASAIKAARKLASLYDHNLGIYAVSRKYPLGLFMDNVEVCGALRDIAESQERLGESKAARRNQARAQAMTRSIVRVFWDKKNHRFRVSTGRPGKPDFFPDAVAQVYPWLANLPTPQDRTRAWSEWKRHYGPVWIGRKRDPHPWGLVALAAMTMGDEDTAACWMAKSALVRNGKNWNVLEEAAYQTLEAQLAAAQRPSTCVLAEAGRERSF